MRILPFVRNVLLAGAIATAFMAPAGAQEGAPTTGRSIETLARVPLKSRAGARILLGSRIAPNKPTLIAIWASWCLPCVAEAPYLDKIRKDLGNGYNFLYVNRSEGNPDPDQPRAAVAQFLARTRMNDVDYVVADVQAYGQIVGADMSNIPEGKVGIPRVYLFDHDGRQIYTTFGFRDEDSSELEQRVKEAMAR
jgi:thiol-disulfide isomerase/thioredoxin